MTIWIVDISNHQGAFPVAAAVKDGYSAVFMKATEGTSFRDGRFDSFAKQVLKTSAIPGAYHFLRNSSGKAQCDAFYSRIKDHGGPNGWLAACDNEADATWSITKAFFARWEELTNGHPLIMYSGNWWWEPRGWKGSALTPYLWDSRYVSGSGYGSTLYKKVPSSWWKSRYGGWSDTTILQFSSSATVAGKSPTDVNAFRGSKNDLLVLAGKSTQPEVEKMDWSDQLSVERYQEALPDLTDTMSAGTLVTATYGNLRKLAKTVSETTQEEETRHAAVMSALENISVGGVDIPLLAAAVAALLPAMPSIDDIATAVADKISQRLTD